MPTAQSASAIPAVEHQADRPQRRPRSLRSWLSIIAASVVVLCGLLYFGTKIEPHFYTAALQVDSDLGRQSGDQFECQVLYLKNEMRRAGIWSVAFTEDQINGWLAFDLIEKFPTALPDGVDSPRIAISDHRLELGFRLNSSIVSGIVSFGGDVFCTDTPNQIGMKLEYARVGWLPLPIGLWADNIATYFNAVGLPMVWTEVDGVPTALIQLPTQIESDRELNFYVSAVELKDGELRFAGFTSGEQSIRDAAHELLNDSLSRFALISKIQRSQESNVR